MSSKDEIYCFVKSLFTKTRDLSSLTQRIIREKFARHRGVDVTSLQAKEKTILKQTVVRCVQEVQEEREKANAEKSDSDDVESDEGDDVISRASSKEDRNEAASSPVKGRGNKRKVIDSDSSEQDLQSSPLKPQKKRQRSSSKNLSDDKENECKAINRAVRETPKTEKTGSKPPKPLTVEAVRNAVLSPDPVSGESSSSSESESENDGEDQSGSNSESHSKSNRTKKSTKAKKPVHSDSELESDEELKKECNKPKPKKTGRKATAAKKRNKNSDDSDFSSGEVSDNSSSAKSNGRKSTVEKKKSKKVKTSKKESSDDISDSGRDAKDENSDDEQTKASKTKKRRCSMTSSESEDERPVKTAKKTAKPRQKKDEAKVSKQKKSSGKKSQSTKSRHVLQLEKIARACGPGVYPVGLRAKKMFADCDTEKKRVKRLKELLESVGMEGEPSMKKAERVKLKREAEELDVGNIMEDSGRGKRKVHSLYSNYQPTPKVVSMTPLRKKLKGLVDSDSASDCEENERGSRNCAHALPVESDSASDCEENDRSNRNCARALPVESDSE